MHYTWVVLIPYLYKFFNLFLERGDGKTEREKHQCVIASHTDRARKPGMCPDWETNKQPFGL